MGVNLRALRKGHKLHGSGKRTDLNGLYVRSVWEANIARYLNWLLKIGEIKSWEYEPTEFSFPIKRGNNSYKPDFHVTEKDGRTYYLEVKGFMDENSRVKLKRMKKFFPEVEVRIIDPPRYKAIAKWRHLIGNWETSSSEDEVVSTAER